MDYEQCWKVLKITIGANPQKEWTARELLDTLLLIEIQVSAPASIMPDFID